jgi:hypothetical protein
MSRTKLRKVAVKNQEFRDKIIPERRGKSKESEEAIRRGNRMRNQVEGTKEKEDIERRRSNCRST